MEAAPHGVIPAIPTPFTADGGEVDVEALRRVVGHVVDGGVHGIMTTGGTGEFPHLSRDERRLVNEVVAAEAAGAVTIFAGTSACATWEAIALDRGRGRRRRRRGDPDAAVLLRDPRRDALPPLRGRGRRGDPAGRRLQQPALHREPPLPRPDRGADGTRRRRRAEAVRGRPRAARRGDEAGRGERPQPLHRDRQPVLRRALRRRPRDLLDRRVDRAGADGPALGPRPGGRPRRGARAAHARSSR